ncbi:hypothetical protein FJZ31_30005 [Candidatus Poribacteria bacterium]|nr:hypothetical protein [Candidatus Poribacteria bacterium]
MAKYVYQNLVSTSHRREVEIMYIVSIATLTPVLITSATASSFTAKTIISSILVDQLCSASAYLIERELGLERKC